MSKIKYLWFINLIMFAVVVFLGIEQAGRGATISHLEDKIEEAAVYKRDLSEEIFKNGSDIKLTQNVTDLGFVKPQEVHYIKTENLFASLPTR